MIWAEDKDVSMTAPCGDSPGILNRKEALGHSRGIFYLGLQGMGMQISPGRRCRTLAGEKDIWATSFSLQLYQDILR